MQWSFLLRRYRVTQVELFALLCRLADELLFRQISWIKKLPFFCELSIEDYTRLLSATWQELILLACLTVYSAQVLGDLANVTDKYTPSDDELQRWGMYSLCHSPFIHSSLIFKHVADQFESLIRTNTVIHRKSLIRIWLGLRNISLLLFFACRACCDP